MGAGVNLALDRLESNVAFYMANNLQHYKPWLVIMSDGQPTDSIDQAVQRARRLESENRLAILMFGIGAGADMNALSAFSAKHKPVKLDHIKLAKLFSQLSRSVTIVANSTPGDAVTLTMTV
jgi:uncharacterized protein YegL